ncbi:hypothetical protein [Oceanobacillus sp. SE10311]
MSKFIEKPLELTKEIPKFKVDSPKFTIKMPKFTTKLGQLL